MIEFSQHPCWIGAKFKFHYNYQIVTWLGLEGGKYDPLDFTTYLRGKFLGIQVKRVKSKYIVMNRNILVYTIWTSLCRHNILITNSRILVVEKTVRAVTQGINPNFGFLCNRTLIIIQKVLKSLWYYRKHWCKGKFIVYLVFQSLKDGCL